MRNLGCILVCFCLALPTYGQNITAMEYFIDIDPGVGNGTLVSITTGPTIDENIIIPTSALPVGFHTLVIRTQDASLAWSIQTSRTFYVSQSVLSTQASIVIMEYFFDIDPGYGNGIPLGITTGTTIDFSTILTTSALPAGFHNIYIRALDVDGVWGPSESRSFFIDGFGNALIDGIESFVDLDPGYGNGDFTDIDPDAASIDQVVNIPLSALPAGDYIIGLRILDTNGNLGQTEFVNVTICDGAFPDFSTNVACEGQPTDFTDLSTSVLVGDTYSWDFEDDAIIDNTTTGDVSFTYPASGTFTATLTIDRAGCTTIFTTTVDVIATPSSNAGSDQGICTDNTVMTALALQVGETGQWTVVSGTGVFNLVSDPVSTITSLSLGINEFQWQVTDPTATCSTTDLVQIEYITVSSPDAGTDQNVCFDNTILTGITQQVGETAQWSVVSGSGTFLDGLDPNTAVTGLAPGINEFAWEVTDGSGTCTVADQVQINYIIPTNALAGSDQSICVDNTTLAGNPPQGAETGLWTLVTGIASITDPTDPLSTLTSITSNTVELQWTITDATGTCFTSDMLTISANLPITAVDANVTVGIGDTLVVDVQSLATINPGDILTTLITSNPTKGAANVLADGSIEYIPNVGNIGTDNVGFEICNQCNNCDSGVITVDIPNNAPELATDTVTVATGTLEVSIDLANLVSDLNNNADLSTLQIVIQPSSGATARIENNILIIDYSGITFNGIDEISIQICDTQGECAVRVLSIEINVSAEEDPPITIFNAVTPNGDGKHDFLNIQNIEFYSDNEVFIYNKIGNLVFNTKNYNNISNFFSGISDDGKEIANGTLYYLIILRDDLDKLSGYILLQK